MAKIWYLRTPAGPDCGSGDKDSLSETIGGAFYSTKNIMSNHSWLREESYARRSKSVYAGDTWWFSVATVKAI